MIKIAGYLMVNALKVYHTERLVMLDIGLRVFFDTFNDLPGSPVNYMIG